MIDAEVALTFFAMCLSLCLIPGPDTVFVFHQSIMQGRAAGISIISGICTAIIFHTIAMACGITVIFQTSELAFVMLKLLGVSYLLFLAWQTFRQPVVDLLSEHEAESVPEPVKNSFLALYRRGILITLSNPVTPVFLLVVMPPFVRIDQGDIFFQLLQLGGILMISVFMVFTVVSFLATTLGGNVIKYRKVQYFLKYGSGVAILMFAVYLSTANQNLT